MTGSTATYVGVEVDGAGDQAYEAIRNAVVGAFREIPMEGDLRAADGGGPADDGRERVAEAPIARVFVVDTQDRSAPADLAALAPGAGSAIVGLSGDIDRATQVAAALTHAFDCILEEPVSGRTITLTVDPAIRPAWLHETG